MWFPPVIQTPAEPVWSAADARAAVLRLGSDTFFDVEIDLHLASAIAEVEKATGQRFGAQTVDLAASGFADLERLPIAPVASVAWVKYLDAAGVEQTIDGDDYALIGGGVVWSIRLSTGVSWPVPIDRPDAVRVRAVVGYADAATIPAELKAAVMLKTRAAFDGVEFDAGDLLVNQRIWL